MDKIREMITKTESLPSAEARRPLLDSLEGKLINLQSQLQDVKDQREQSLLNMSSATSSASTVSSASSSARGGYHYSSGVAGRGGGGGGRFLRGGGGRGTRGWGGGRYGRGGGGYYYSAADTQVSTEETTLASDPIDVQVETEIFEGSRDYEEEQEEEIQVEAGVEEEEEEDQGDEKEFPETLDTISQDLST